MSLQVNSSTKLVRGYSAAAVNCQHGDRILRVVERGPLPAARLRIKRSSITRYIGHGGSLLGLGIESRLDDILDPFSPHEAQLAAGAFRDILVVLAIAGR